MPNYQEKLEDLMQSFIQSNPAALHCTLLSSNGDVVVSVVSKQEDIYYHEDMIIPQFQNLVKNIRTKLHIDFLNHIILETEDYKIHTIQINPGGSNSVLVLVEYNGLILSLGNFFVFSKKIGIILEQLENEQEIKETDNPFSLNKVLYRGYIPKVLFFAEFDSDDIKIYEILPSLDKYKIRNFAIGIQESTADIIKKIGINFNSILISSEELSIIGLLSKRNNLIFAVTHQAPLGALMIIMNRFRNFKYFEDISNVYDIILREMKIENKNTLKIERKQIYEMFNEYIWIIGEKSVNYPNLIMMVKLILEYKGIEIEYDGKWIIFKNIALNKD